MQPNYQRNSLIYLIKVEPLLSGHSLSSHALSGGQLLKSREYSQYNIVTKIFTQRPQSPFGRPDKASPIQCSYPYLAASMKKFGFVSKQLLTDNNINWRPKNL